jgi:hypothetical protein
LVQEGFESINNSQAEQSEIYYPQQQFDPFTSFSFSNGNSFNQFDLSPPFVIPPILSQPLPLPGEFPTTMLDHDLFLQGFPLPLPTEFKKNLLPVEKQQQQ